MNLKDQISGRIRQNRQIAGIWTAAAIAGALWLALTGIFPLWPGLLIGYGTFNAAYFLLEVRKLRKILNDPLFYLLEIEHSFATTNSTEVIDVPRSQN